MQNKLSNTLTALLALAFPMAALADFSNTQTISSGQHVTMDNGSTGTSGGDIAFTGTSITPQGSAKFYDYTMGSAGAEASEIYSEITSAAFSFLTFTTTPISGGSLVAGEIFAVHDNAGNYAKVWITAVSSTSLTIQYDTFGAAAGGNTPSITAVLDAGGYTASVAEGSIFVVKGSNLSLSGYTTTSYPLPPSFQNTSIAFTPQAGGSPTAAYIVYLYNQSGVNQLAAILPSTVAVGYYNVTVTYNGNPSSPFSVQVVKQKPGLLTADSTGNGLVLDQNYISQTEYDINRFTTGTLYGDTISPGHPGQTMIVWMTGLGPVPFADNTASPAYNFAANGQNIQVLVNGTAVTPFYAGSAPGLSAIDQIDFTLPANVTTGCTVPLQISENGILSQPTFISIAPAGANACVLPGYTTAQLQAFDDGASVYTGGFTISQTSENYEGMASNSSSASGLFTQYTGFELSAAPAPVTTTESGCIVTQIMPTTGSTPSPGGKGIILDAGKVTLTGPAGSSLNNTQLPETSNIYDLTLSATGSPTIGTIVAGAYTLNAAGGAGVGAFNATVTLGAPFVVTGGLPSTVTRGAGLTINWTGGNASDGVVVGGYATTGTGDAQTGALFDCFTTAGAKTLTVNSSILDQLPAITAAAIAAGTAIGSLSVSSSVTPTTGDGYFNAPLTAGGSVANATFLGSTYISGSAAYQ